MKHEPNIQNAIVDTKIKEAIAIKPIKKTKRAEAICVQAPSTKKAITTKQQPISAQITASNIKEDKYTQKEIKAVKTPINAEKKHIEKSPISKYQIKEIHVEEKKEQHVVINEKPITEVKEAPKKENKKPLVVNVSVAVPVKKIIKDKQIVDTPKEKAETIVNKIKNLLHW